MVSVITFKSNELAQSLPIFFLDSLPTHCSFCKLPLDISPTLTKVTCTNNYCSSIKFGKMKYLLSELGVEVSESALTELTNQTDKNLLDTINSIDEFVNLLQELSLKDLILLFIGQGFSTPIEQLFKRHQITSTKEFFCIFQSLETLQKTMEEYEVDLINDNGREIFNIVISELYERVLDNKVLVEGIHNR